MAELQHFPAHLPSALIVVYGALDPARLSTDFPAELNLSNVDETNTKTNHIFAALDLFDYAIDKVNFDYAAFEQLWERIDGEHVWLRWPGFGLAQAVKWPRWEMPARHESGVFALSLKA